MTILPENAKKSHIKKVMQVGEKLCSSEENEKGTDWDALIENYEYLTGMIMAKLKTCQQHSKDNCLTLEDMYDLDMGHGHYLHKDSLWLWCVLGPVRSLPKGERWKKWNDAQGFIV